MVERGARCAVCDTRGYRSLGSRQGLNEVCAAGLTLPPLVPRSTLQADLRVHRVRRHVHHQGGLGGAAPRLQAVAAEPTWHAVALEVICNLDRLARVSCRQKFLCLVAGGSTGGRYCLALSKCAPHGDLMGYSVVLTGRERVTLPVNLAPRPPIAGHAISNRVTSPSNHYYTPSSKLLHAPQRCPHCIH